MPEHLKIKEEQILEKPERGRTKIKTNIVLKAIRVKS